MDINEAKTILSENGYTLNENIDVGTDWYHSDARKALEDYMLNLIVPEVCKKCEITTEDFWKCFQNDFYMDYMLPLGPSMINDWANKAIRDMSNKYFERNGIE